MAKKINRKRWSKSELDLLRSNKSHKSLSRLLKRTMNSIQSKRSNLGINFSKAAKKAYEGITKVPTSASSTINIQNAKTIVVTPNGVDIKF